MTIFSPILFRIRVWSISFWRYVNLQSWPALSGPSQPAQYSLNGQSGQSLWILFLSLFLPLCTKKEPKKYRLCSSMGPPTPPAYFYRWCLTLNKNKACSVSVRFCQYAFPFTLSLFSSLRSNRKEKSTHHSRVLSKHLEFLPHPNFWDPSTKSKVGQKEIC